MTTPIVCPVNPPGHDWQNGLVCHWCKATRTAGEAILSQLESRRGGDPASAQRLLDAHRAEVFAEAAAIVGNDDTCDCGGCGTCIPRWLADRLRAMAGEGTAAAAATPDFFEPGHTYTEADGSTDWKFRCDAITTHPEDGERTALGWRHFKGQWAEYSYGEDDWDVHQHVGTFDMAGAGESS